MHLCANHLNILQLQISETALVYRMLGVEHVIQIKKAVP